MLLVLHYILKIKLFKLKEVLQEYRRGSSKPKLPDKDVVLSDNLS
jgi:hypothetical protein